MRRPETRGGKIATVFACAALPVVAIAGYRAMFEQDQVQGLQAKIAQVEECQQHPELIKKQSDNRLSCGNVALQLSQTPVTGEGVAATDFAGAEQHLQAQIHKDENFGWEDVGLPAVVAYVGACAGALVVVTGARGAVRRLI